MNSPLPRVRGRPLTLDVLAVLLLLGLISLAILWVMYDVALVRQMWRLHMNDFGRFYYSAQYLLEGRDLYGPSPATLMPVSDVDSRQLWNLNPPHFQLLICPLGALSPGAALLVWTAASLASLALATRALVRAIGPLRWTPTQVVLVCFGLLAFAGTGSLLLTGQLSWLLLWPVITVWLDLRSGRWHRAGAILGALATVKPFFAILFAVLILRRQFRPLVTGVLAGSATIALGVLLTGPESYLSWLRALRSTDWSQSAMNASILGVLSRSLSANPYFAPFVHRPDLILPLWAVLAVSVAACTIGAVVRREQTDASFSLLLLAGLLVSPLGWVYYWWFVLPPLVVLIGKGLLRKQWVLAVPIVLSALWPLPATLMSQPSPFATITVGSLYFWGMFLLWIAVLRDRPPCPASTLTAA